MSIPMSLRKYVSTEMSVRQNFGLINNIMISARNNNDTEYFNKLQPYFDKYIPYIEAMERAEQ